MEFRRRTLLTSIGMSVSALAGCIGSYEVCKEGEQPPTPDVVSTRRPLPPYTPTQIIITNNIPPWIEALPPVKEREVIEELQNDPQFNERFNELPDDFASPDLDRAHAFRSRNSIIVSIPLEIASDNQQGSIAIRIQEEMQEIVRSVKTLNEKQQPQKIDFHQLENSTNERATLEINWEDKKKIKNIQVADSTFEIDTEDNTCNICMEVLQVIIATGCGVGGAVICAAANLKTLAASALCTAIAASVCYYAEEISEDTVSPVICQAI